MRIENIMPGSLEHKAYAVPRGTIDTDMMSGKQLREERGGGHEAINGAELLDDIAAELARFFWQPEWEQWMEALWVVYTHAYTAFDHAPILGVYSPVPGCAKTDKLIFLSNVVRDGVLEANPTPATLYREIECSHPTLLLDEMDKAHWPSLRAIVNSGFTRGVTVPRCEGEDFVVRHFSPFGPKALATMGKELPGDTADRALMVRMRKKPAGEKVIKFKSALHVPRLHELRDKASVWAGQHRSTLIEAEPTLPEVVYNRGADRWLPLFAVADAAGGDWPDRVRDAALAHEGKKGYGDIKLTLLSHVLALKADWPKDRLLTAGELSAALMAREDWPWDELTAGKLGGMLKTLGVTSEKQWVPALKGQARLFGWGRLQDAAKEYGVKGPE